MEFQINEAIELVKALAETENLTKTQALGAFVAEAELSAEDASVLKAELFEEYTLSEMASDSLTSALHRVFVTGISEESEELQEVDTKETQEGTKYKVRVKDRASGSTYSRYATRAKIAELRANPNISSVELSDYGDAGEDKDGQRTAAAKTGRDYDGDGKKESSSKEHAGVVHNAIQRKMGGKPDGQDTRKEEYELEEGKKEADLDKMKRQEDKHLRKAISQKGGSRGTSKNRSMKMGSIRSAIERGEDPRRDTYGGKRTTPEDHRKAYTRTPMKDRPAKEPGVKKESAWEAYLELREGKKKELDEARAKTREEARAKLEANRKAIESGKPEESPYGAHLKKKGEGKDPWSTHASDAKAHKKEDQKEGYVIEADLVDSGRENQSQRDKKKLDGKGVDNSTNVKLMPNIDESVVTEHEAPLSQKRLAEASKNEELRARIKSLVAEECCPKCGTPECTCESKKEEKPRKKKAKLDEAGMPILEYSRNNATGPTPEMINPGKDPEGEPGVMNPKGKPKRYKNKGEAPGDRRPNDPSGPELPFDKGTVPNGSGV